MLKKITIAVIGLHLALISTLLFSPVRKIEKKNRNLAVRVKQAIETPVRTKTAKKTAQAEAALKVPAQKTASAKKTSPKAAQETARPKTVAKPPSTPKQKGKPAVHEPAKKQKPKERAPEIFQAAPPSKKEVRPSRPLPDVPAAPATLFVESKEPLFVSSDPASGYHESLMECLRASLHLPEYGEVRIQLTLRQDGSVVKVAVLNAESAKNKVYLEKNLPLLHFPALDRFDFTKKEQTFIITFCNEI